MGTYLSHPVPKNLTLHRMSKMEFQPDFRNPQMLSFLNMCNTMGSKMDGLAVREHFLSKNAEKTAFWAATFSDHLTSENLGHKLSDEPWADLLGSKLSDWQPIENFFWPAMENCPKWPPLSVWS